MTWLGSLLHEHWILISADCREFLEREGEGLNAISEEIQEMQEKQEPRGSFGGTDWFGEKMDFSVPLGEEPDVGDITVVVDYEID